MKRADSVHNPIAIDAEWWLPQTPEVRVRGKLSGRVSSELHLSTEGNLGDDFHARDSDLIILGESRAGERYALLQCVLAMLLLKDAEFSEAQIENIIKNNWAYSQLQRRTNEEAKSNKRQEEA